MGGNTKFLATIKEVARTQTIHGLWLMVKANILHALSSKLRCQFCALNVLNILLLPIYLYYNYVQFGKCMKRITKS